MLRASLAAVCFGALAACEAGPPGAPGPEGEAGADPGVDGGASDADAALELELDVEIGTGEDRFVALDDADRVDIVAGPQGGHHVWTSVRVHDPSVERIELRLSARFQATGELAGPPSRLVAAPGLVDGRREHAGMTNFIDDPGAVEGRRVVVRVEAEAEGGRAGSDERAVVPKWPWTP